MAQQLQPEVLDADAGYLGSYVTIIYNNETNSFEEVIETLCYATGCGIEEAYIETWEAHTYGKSGVHYGTQEVCCAVASIISSIGIKTEVRPEWEE